MSSDCKRKFSVDFTWTNRWNKFSSFFKRFTLNKRTNEFRSIFSSRIDSWRKLSPKIKTASFVLSRRTSKSFSASSASGRLTLTMITRVFSLNIDRRKTINIVDLQLFVRGKIETRRRENPSTIDRRKQKKYRSSNSFIDKKTRSLSKNNKTISAHWWTTLFFRWYLFFWNGAMSIRPGVSVFKEVLIFVCLYQLKRFVKRSLDER